MSGEIQVEKISTCEMDADFLTNAMNEEEIVKANI